MKKPPKKPSKQKKSDHVSKEKKSQKDTNWHLLALLILIIFVQFIVIIQLATEQEEDLRCSDCAALEYRRPMKGINYRQYSKTDKGVSNEVV